MTLIVLAAIVLIALLAPVLGADSRHLSADEGPTRDKLWSRPR